MQYKAVNGVKPGQVQARLFRSKPQGIRPAGYEPPAANRGVSPGGIVLFAASGWEFDPEKLKEEVIKREL
jgi:hypothetical protein